MQKIVELKIEETKAVVGGNRYAVSANQPLVVRTTVGMLPPPSLSVNAL
jgi:hypothetical protein